MKRIYEKKFPQMFDFCRWFLFTFDGLTTVNGGPYISWLVDERDTIKKKPEG